MSYQLHTYLAIAICCALIYTADTTENSEICFESYIERSLNLTESYTQSHLECHNHRWTKRTFLTREKELEMEQIRNGTAKICENLQSCNEYDAHEEFYNCHLDNYGDNMDMLITIHLNASAAVVVLSSQYEEIEKEVMLCQIEAQRVYMSETRNSLRELHMCLTV